MKLIKVCHNNFTVFYDDGLGNWVEEDLLRNKRTIIDKTQQPYLPYFSVVDYGMEVDDEQAIDALREEYRKSKITPIT